MSVTVQQVVDEPGEAEHVEAAWELKEEIRRREDVLKQRRGFFTRAYRRATVYLLYADGDLAGFTAARQDGYILFLAVSPAYRGRGFGERLVAAVADESRSVTCHARVSNEEALGFYFALGFERVRRIDNYYEDGGDAYYLRLGEEASLRERLTGWFR